MKQTTLLLLLTLALTSSYSQSVPLKKIGEDTVLILPIAKAAKINQVYKEQRDSIYWLEQESIVMRQYYMSLIRERDDKFFAMKKQYDSSLVRNTHIDKKYADLKIESIRLDREYKRTFRGMATYIVLATIFAISVLNY